MTTIGILVGLFAATMQSSSYICSRIFSEKHPKATAGFLIYTHIQMGIISSIVTFFIWPDDFPDIRVFLVDFLMMCFPYFLAQSCLFMILKSTNASKIAPLLALKIVVLVLISMFFMKESYTFGQWCAFCMVIGSAFLLNKVSGGIGGKNLILIGIACTGYALSDIFIKRTVDHFNYMGDFLGIIFTTSLCYTFLGTTVLIAVPFTKKFTRQQFVDAIPFSCTWLFAMVFLFSSFGIIGAVYGNIVQSSRGVISILIGTIIASLGYVHLESKTNKTVLIKRTCAALLITLAIILFNVFRQPVINS